MWGEGSVRSGGKTADGELLENLQSQGQELHSAEQEIRELAIEDLDDQKPADVSSSDAGHIPPGEVLHPRGCGRGSSIPRGDFLRGAG